MKPAPLDFEIWRGSDAVLSIRVKNDDGTAFDHTGSSWLLFYEIAGTRIEVAGVLGGDGVLTFTIPNRGRELPLGRSVRHEIHRHIGTQQEAWFYGFIIGAGGLNRD